MLHPDEVSDQLCPVHRCPESRNLLTDLPLPSSKQQRVGPHVSRRIYHMLTCENPEAKIEDLKD